MSAMGMYQQVLGIYEDSHILPKFVALTILEIPGPPQARKLKVSMLDKSNPIVEVEMNIEPVNNGTLAEITEAYMYVSLPVEITPFTAKDGMNLQIRISSDDFDYESSRLKVVKGQLRKAPV